MSVTASERTGWVAITRLIVRLDRVRIVLWTAGIAAMVLLSAASIVNLYTTPEDLERYARLVRGNAALIVQSGPGFGLDDPTIGAVLVNEAAIWTIIAVAVLSILMTTRHTRAEEDAERAHLLRSLPVGRHADAVGTLTAVGGTQALVAVTLLTGLVLSGYPVIGSVALTVSVAGAGLVFAAVTLVTAQIAASARGATGLALLVLGVSFVLRAIGDVGNGVLSWLSPIGWAQAIRAYADERWWVLALPLVATIVLLALADALADRRDLGSGLLAQRVGPAVAPPSLRGPRSLAWRLQRGSVAAWTVGLAALGFFYGIVADQAEQMVLDNPDLEDFFAALGSGTITDAFLATGMLVLALGAVGFVVSAVLRTHVEERDGRVDPLLATPLSRASWGSSHLVVGMLSMFAMLAIGGAAMGLGMLIAAGDATYLAQLAFAGGVLGVGVGVLAAVAFLLVAAVPRWSIVAWAVVAFTAAVGLLGGVLDVPDWVLDLSPLRHVPAIPADPFRWAPVAALAAVSVAITAAGLGALRRRDVGRS